MRQRLRVETAWEDVVGLHCAMRAASVQGNAVAAYDELEKASAPFSKVCLVISCPFVWRVHTLRGVNFHFLSGT